MTENKSKKSSVSDFRGFPNRSEPEATNTKTISIAKPDVDSSTKAKSCRTKSSDGISRRSQREIARIEIEFLEKKLQLEEEIMRQKLKFLKMNSEGRKSSVSDVTEEDESQHSIEDNIQKWVNEIPDDSNKTYKMDKPEDLSANAMNVQKILFRQSSGTKDLPSFAGDPMEWPTFLTYFHETTEVCGFSKRENMCRLQKALKGKAKESVQYLLNFPEQLEKVLGILERRFGRPEHIIEEVINKIKHMPYLKEYNFESLIDYTDKIMNLVATIESLDSTGHLMNTQLLNELVSKLPSNIKLQWGIYRNSHDNTADLKTFASWLEEIASGASYVSRPRFYNEKTANFKGKGETSLVTAENKPRECIYCKNKKHSHSITKCKYFSNISVDERWNWVKTNKVCFACLRPNHQIQFCKQKRECGENSCKKYHHPILHSSDSINSRNNATTNIINDEPCSSGISQTIRRQDQETNFNATQWTNKKVLLRIVPVIVRGYGGKQVEIYALLDEASTVTLLDADVARQLDLNGPSKSLHLRWTNNMSNYMDESQIVSVDISGVTSGCKIFTMHQVRTVENLSLPSQTINIDELSRKWPYIKNVSLNSMTDATPTLLIGQDNWPLTIPRSYIHKRWNDPVLTKTWLGWIIHGQIYPNESEDTKYYSCFICNPDEDQEDNLYNLVKKSFEIEDIGLTDKKTVSREEKYAEELLEKSTRRINNTEWETGLLWKNTSLKLPPSKENALKRLEYIERRMKKDKEFAESYKEKINDYISKGYARKLSTEEIMENNCRIWYLPHFAVVNPNKPGKIRTVFDAAAKSCGISLNENLLTGPDLYNSIPKILWKFRAKKIAFSADIKEMFLRINIRKEDLPAQRFLWRDHSEEEADTYEMTVMLFGAVCSPSSAQYVRIRNAEEFKDEFPEAADAIINYHYMDDYLDSCENEEKAIKQIQEVIDIHSRGNFMICNWSCNSKRVLDHIPRELLSKESKNLNIESDTAFERVLGLHWNSKEDKFFFKLKFHKVRREIIEENCVPTKRELLQFIMSIFDPLGFVANIIIYGKILLQELWKLKVKWDDTLPEQFENKWTKFKRVIQQIENLQIDRCFTKRVVENLSIQIHIFCDASDKAYSAVAYLRIKDNEFVETAFIMAKARVAPLKTISIPRLELLAALLASEMLRFILDNNALKFSKIFLWTDSRTVLHWLKNTSLRLQQYVSNRVEKIRELTNTNWWNWIDTKNNVADEATKWTADPKIDRESRWLTGPGFLRNSEAEWLKLVEDEKEPLGNLEVKECTFIVAPYENNPALPCIEHFSSWLKLIRVTGQILYFIEICRKVNISEIERGLKPLHLKKAELLWWKEVQKTYFLEEMKHLKRHGDVETNSKLYQLTPFMDENGVIRMRTRLNSAPVDANMKNPVILHPDHRFCELLVRRKHELCGHLGQEYVLHEIKQNYWILNCRTLVKKVLKACIFCKKKRSKKTESPLMGSLPEARVAAFYRPFTHTGMDYFGPLEVTVGRHREKRYGVIFTCLTTRAVHIEVAHTLNTSSTIMAIQRMSARRGTPVHIYSDNGTNLRGAEKELKKALEELDRKQMNDLLTNRNITWHFIPPASPHMGGSWERLIRSIKNSFYTILKERAPRDEVLRTLLIEAESIVNNRPLTHISIDPTDMEPLTPNHFLIGSSMNTTLLGTFEDDLCSKKQWRVAQSLTNMLWKRWIREYLPTLCKRTKWHNQNTTDLAIDDVVILMNDNTPRNSWPMGLILKTYPGRDGRVRVVDVKVNSQVYKRPVTKIIPLITAKNRTEETRIQDEEK